MKEGIKGRKWRKVLREGNREKWGGKKWKKVEKAGEGRKLDREESGEVGIVKKCADGR